MLDKLEMCPKDKCNTYWSNEKEHTLVQIILKNVPAEYDAAVETVMDMMKLRKFNESGNFKGFTNKEDHTRVNYDTEWIPPYDELRACGARAIVAAPRTQKKRFKQIYQVGTALSRTKDTSFFKTLLIRFSYMHGVAVPVRYGYGYYGTGTVPGNLICEVYHLSKID